MTAQAPRFLPYGRQQVLDEDVAAVTAVLRSDYLTTGPVPGRFEAALAARVDAPFAVACANGTAALHLAMLALGLKPGATVIVPAITFVATANAARFCGAEVVFADVDADTGLLTVETLADAFERAAKPVAAVAAVHLAGQSADMPALASLAAQHGARLIEDASHAVGTIHGDAPVGACRHSDMATFSFHPVKTVTAAEGGAVTTRNPVLADRLRLFANHGITRDAGRFALAEAAFAADGEANPWYYEQQLLGFNYRLADLNAALVLSQLGRLDAIVARRRALVAHYDGRLAAWDDPRIRPLARMPGQSVGWHLYVALIDFAAFGLDRAAVIRSLRARGIGAQVHYIPVPSQPYYRDRQAAPALPGATAYYARCLSLPLFPDMMEGDVDRVLDALGDILGTR